MRRQLKLTLILLMAAAGLCLALEPFDPLVSRLVAFCGLIVGLALVPFISGGRDSRASRADDARAEVPAERVRPTKASACPRKRESFIRL